MELKGRAGAPLDALLSALDQSVELSAYAAASLGTKLLQERDYDHARLYLCKADSTLATPRTPAPPSALVKWVRDLTLKAVEQALADPNYQGAMRLREDHPRRAESEGTPMTLHRWCSLAALVAAWRCRTTRLPVR